MTNAAHASTSLTVSIILRPEFQNTYRQNRKFGLISTEHTRFHPHARLVGIWPPASCRTTRTKLKSVSLSSVFRGLIRTAAGKVSRRPLQEEGLPVRLLITAAVPRGETGFDMKLQDKKKGKKSPPSGKRASQNEIAEFPRRRTRWPGPSAGSGPRYIQYRDMKYSRSKSPLKITGPGGAAAAVFRGTGIMVYAPSG